MSKATKLLIAPDKTVPFDYFSPILFINASDPNLKPIVIPVETA
jgi:hypothetical protein